MNPTNYIMPCPKRWFLWVNTAPAASSTEKSDLYSYGLVLLEILSGRSAIKLMVSDNLHIVEWAKKKMGTYEPAVNILDPKLCGIPDQLVQEMLQTLGIAIFCVNPAPGEQPTMKEAAGLPQGCEEPAGGVGEDVAANQLIRTAHQTFAFRQHFLVSLSSRIIFGDNLRCLAEACIKNEFNKRSNKLLKTNSIT